MTPFALSITSDVPRHSLESSTHNLKRKDSSNSVSSVKEPDIPDTDNDMYSVISTKKVKSTSCI